MKVYATFCDECEELCAYSNEVMDNMDQPMIICLKCFIQKEERYQE